MRDLTYPHPYSSFLPLNFSSSFLKILFFFGGIFLNFLGDSPTQALPLTSTDPHKFTSLAAGKSTTMPLPDGLKTPSTELPSFQYTPEVSNTASTEMKYNPETKEAIRNDAQPL